MATTRTHAFASPTWGQHAPGRFTFGLWRLYQFFFGKRVKTTFAIFLLTLCLSAGGLVMVYSASAGLAPFMRKVALAKKDPQAARQLNQYYDATFLVKQATWLGVGLLAMLMLYYLDYQKLAFWAPLVLLATLGLLIAVLIVGREVNGAKRWMNIAGFTFQPSEFAKLALIVYMAKMLTDKRKEIRDFMTGLLPCLLLTGAFIVAIIIEPDLGAAVVVALITATMWFVAGMRWRHMFLLASVGIVGVVAAVLKEPWRLQRVIAWITQLIRPAGELPKEFLLGKGYQLNQSLIALGSGGSIGLGLGEGLQKNQFLMEAHTDFIFAIIGEELGLVGTLAFLVLFALLVLQGIKVALKVPDTFGSLLAAGLTFMVAVPVLINVGVVTGLLPTKGLALPFVSYGGSSLIVSLAGMGILMNISNFQELQEEL